MYSNTLNINELVAYERTIVHYSKNAERCEKYVYSKPIKYYHIGIFTLTHWNIAISKFRLKFSNVLKFVGLILLLLAIPAIYILAFLVSTLVYYPVLRWLRGKIDKEKVNFHNELSNMSYEEKVKTFKILNELVRKINKYTKPLKVRKLSPFNIMVKEMFKVRAGIKQIEVMAKSSITVNLDEILTKEQISNLREKISVLDSDKDWAS